MDEYLAEMAARAEKAKWASVGKLQAFYFWDGYTAALEDLRLTVQEMLREE